MYLLHWTTDSTERTKRGRGPTKGLGLEKALKLTGGKMAIDIPIDKGRPTDVEQSSKLSSEMGIVARNLIPIPKNWKNLSQDDKDLALERLNVSKINLIYDEYRVFLHH